MHTVMSSFLATLFDFRLWFAPVKSVSNKTEARTCCEHLDSDSEQRRATNFSGLVVCKVDGSQMDHADTKASDHSSVAKVHHTCEHGR